MHGVAVVLVAAAGLAYCLVAWLRWRAVRSGDDDRGRSWLLGAALALHSLAIVLSLVEGAHAPFLYGAIGSWAAIASVVFVARWLAVPSARLLALPVGGMALLVAVASAGRAGDDREASSWITGVHVVFMSGHLAAVLVAAAAGALYHVATRQLKNAAPGAFRLPSLPLLERLTHGGLVFATALLLGGLATGGVLVGRVPGFTLAHPTVLISLGTMAVLIAGLAVRLANRVGRRGEALAALTALALSVLSLLSLMADRHG